MLAIQQGKEYQPKCVPNVLPCRINHSGPVNASTRYWTPTEVENGKAISYFRGRKLHGRTVKLPESYKGVVVSSNAGDMLRESHPSKDNLSDDGDEEEPTTEVGIMEEQASFEKLMIWGHEVLPNDGVDPYVRGVDEWIAFAEQIHSHSTQNGDNKSELKQG